MRSSELKCNRVLDEIVRVFVALRYAFFYKQPTLICAWYFRKLPSHVAALSTEGPLNGILIYSVVVVAEAEYCVK